MRRGATTESRTPLAQRVMLRTPRPRTEVQKHAFHWPPHRSRRSRERGGRRGEGRPKYPRRRRRSPSHYHYRNWQSQPRLVESENSAPFTKSMDRVCLSSRLSHSLALGVLATDRSMVDSNRTSPKVRYSKAIPTLYGKGYPFLSIGPLPISSSGIKFTS